MRRQRVKWAGWCFGLSALALFWGCLERNNPWDPVNRVIANPDTLDQDTLTVFEIDSLPDSLINEIEGEVQADLFFINDSILLLKTTGDSLYEAFLVEKENRDSTTFVNDSLITRNTLIDSNNDKLDTLGNVSCYTLKTSLFYLTFVNSIPLSEPLTEVLVKWTGISQYTLTYIDSVKNLYSDRRILVGYRDSVENEFKEYSNILNIYKGEVDSVNQDYLGRNDSLISRNNEVSVTNNLVSSFNQAVKRSPQFCNVRLSDPLAIRQSVNNLTPGDSLFLDSGIIELQVVIQVSGEEGAPIVIYGDTLGGTVLSYSSTEPILIDNTSYVEIHNISFNDCGQSGFKMVNSSGPVKMVNCNFERNNVRGLEALDSDVELINCRFVDNGAEGIFLTATSLEAEIFHFQNILIARNGSHGFSGLTVSGTIENSTIVGNTGDGILMNIPHRSVIVRNSIVTDNELAGIHRAEVDGAEGELELDSVTLFQNQAGNLVSLPPYDTLSFNSQDPAYIDSINYESSTLTESGYKKDY